MLKTNNNPSFNFIGLAILSLTFLASVVYQNQNINYLVLTKALLIILAAVIFWNSAKGAISLPRNSLAIAAALFWCCLLINIPLGSIIENNTYTVWLISLLPGIFFLYQITPIYQRDWNWLFTGFVIIASALSLHYIYQVNSSNLPFNGAGASLFPNRNIFAALLNIIILASSAYFINLKLQQKHIGIQILIGAALFLMIYAMAITQSRGGLIAFFTTYALLFLLFRKSVSRRILLNLIFIIITALILANSNLHASNNLISNLATLNEPSSAGSSRFLIWEATWRMIQDAPLLGHGAGTFSLLYPQYRLPGDNSGGLFAHNDYLQIWSEMGLPVLITFIALLITAAITFIKYWRSTDNINAQLEVAGLFCGLTSVAIHSLFTFNLYMLSILVLSGMFLGRFNQLCTSNLTSRININLTQILSPILSRSIIIIIAIVSLQTLASTSAHQHYYQQAITEHKQKKFDQANKSFALSNKLVTTYATLASHASLLSDSIETWPKSDTKKRKLLYVQALEMLDEAQVLNPLRQTHYGVRAHLFLNYPEFSGSNHVQLAKDNYQRIIDLNPRHFKARYLLAKLLISENKPRKALILLEQGLNEYYSPWQNTAPYLQLIKTLRVKKDDETGANALTATIEKRQRAYQAFEKRKKSNNL